MFQKKPCPKRSLASRLSGHKPNKKRQTQTSSSNEASVPQVGQSDTSTQLKQVNETDSGSQATGKSDVTESKSLTSLLNIPSKSICSELTVHPVVHLLEPLLL